MVLIPILKLNETEHKSVTNLPNDIRIIHIASHQRFKMLLEIFVKCLENLKLSNTILIFDKLFDVYLHFHYYF